MRWGILWRTLQYDLKKSTVIVRVCMLLHNFIVDHRQTGDTEDNRFFSNFDIQMDTVQSEVTRQTGEFPRALVTDNNEPARIGRPTVLESELRQKGEEIRLRLLVKLAASNMRRPMQCDMEYNDYGNIYTTS